MAPQILFLEEKGIDAEHYVAYWNDTISIQYQFTKASDSKGLKTVHLRWKDGSAPGNNNDYTANISVYLSPNINSYSTAVDIHLLLGIQFLMNHTYYYWAYAEDWAGNTQNTYIQARHFIIEDKYAPELELGANNLNDSGYLDDFVLEFTLNEINGTYMNSSGVNPSSVKLEYTINQ